MKRRAAPPISTNRRRRAAGNQILEVRVRRSTARRQQSRRAISWALGIILWIAVAICTYVGVRAITDKFFLSNPDYDLRVVEVDGGGLFTEEEVLDLAGFEIGKNIFSADLGKAEAAIRQFDQVASARIERHWPDKITVAITQREPVAWLVSAKDPTLSTDNARLVDADGGTMRAHRVAPETWRLPVIYCENPDAIAAGDPLATDDLRRALALLHAHSSRPTSRLAIRSLDIRKGYAIEAVDDTRAHYRFSAAADPADQLDRLEQILRYSEETGRRIERADLMPRRFTPVDFALSINASPEEGDPPAPRP